jgi:hypothetical protein
MTPLRAPLAPPSKCFNRGQCRERWPNPTGSYRAHPGTGKSKKDHAHRKKRIGGYERNCTNLCHKLRAERFTLGLDKWNREEDPNYDSTEKTFEGVYHVITYFKTGALEQAIFTSRHARVCATDTISLNSFVIAQDKLPLFKHCADFLHHSAAHMGHFVMGFMYVHLNLPARHAAGVRRK